MATTLEWIRSFRIAGMAAFDWVVTIVVSRYLWAYGLEKSWWRGVSFHAFLAFTVALGIVCHKVAGVRTPLEVHLGLS